MFYGLINSLLHSVNGECEATPVPNSIVAQ